VDLFAAGDGQLDLGPAAAKIHTQRHQREAALGGLAREFGDLSAMQQQFPRAFRLVVHPVAHGVFRNVAAQQPNLAAVDLGVGVFEAGAAFAQTFHFRSRLDDAALQLFEDVVLVKCALIARDGLDAFFLVVGFFWVRHDNNSRSPLGRD
jgi:hypothetical protein